jgi:hypothetical protein
MRRGLSSGKNGQACSFLVLSARKPLSSIDLSHYRVTMTIVLFVIESVRFRAVFSRKLSAMDSPRFAPFNRIRSCAALPDV